MRNFVMLLLTLFCMSSHAFTNTGEKINSAPSESLFRSVEAVTVERGDTLSKRCVPWLKAMGLTKTVSVRRCALEVLRLSGLHQTEDEIKSLRVGSRLLVPTVKTNSEGVKNQIRQNRSGSKHVSSPLRDTDRSIAPDLSTIDEPSIQDDHVQMDETRHSHFKHLWTLEKQRLESGPAEVVSPKVRATLEHRVHELELQVAYLTHRLENTVSQQQFSGVMQSLRNDFNQVAHVITYGEEAGKPIKTNIMKTEAGSYIFMGVAVLFVFLWIQISDYLQKQGDRSLRKQQPIALPYLQN